MMKAIIEAMIKKEVTMIAEMTTEMTAMEIMTIITGKICALGVSRLTLQSGTANHNTS
jgi:hypothetical protein